MYLVQCQVLGPAKRHPHYKVLVRCPTLHELIEACITLEEDGDFHLEHLNHNQWGAGTCKHEGWLRASTAAEAVAKLWIKLNEIRKAA